MSTAPFDGTAYRKQVLAPLREANAADVEDLFWLASVPRDLDDDAEIAARLRATRGFLNKELSRARQAAVAAAVLKEWPRVARCLGDAVERRTLRERLGSGGAAAPKPTAAPKAARRNTDPVARRRRQVAANLQELARLRDEPELADDLFAFLGLSTSATKPIIEQRLAKVGEVNRRRRADRERTLTDELLAHARELLVVDDPATYLAGFAHDAAAAVVDALLSGDVEAALSSRTEAGRHGVADAAILAALAEPARAQVEPVPVSALGLGAWCPGCGMVGPPGTNRCATCGGSLVVICAACRTQCPADLPRCGNCSASLDDARAPLLERRSRWAAEQEALAAVDAAPEAEHAGRLIALARANPTWDAVRRRRDALPPAAPAQVTVAYSSGEARLTWPEPDEPDLAFLVERVEGTERRVLGRTSVTTWTDRATPGDGVSWDVRTLRGESASRPTRAVSAVMARPRRREGSSSGPAPAPAPRLRDVRARATAPVRLSWTAPSGSTVAVVRIERRPEGIVRRALTPDAADGYSDRHVGRGRRYEYEISLAGTSDPPQVLHVTVGDGTVVVPGAPSADVRRRTASTPTRNPRPDRPAPRTGSAPGGGGSKAATLERDDQGRLVARWRWPEGVTEAFVAWGDVPPRGVEGQGRKMTNARYAIDGGAVLPDVPAGAHVAVVMGHRDAGGTLRWDPIEDRHRSVAP